MRLAERDNSFLFRPNPKDKRKNLYAVIEDDSSKIVWRTKSYVINNIQNGCISNAKVHGNNNIVKVKEDIKVEKINETNYNILKRYALNFLSNVRDEDMIYMYEDCDRYKGIINNSMNYRIINIEIVI